MAGVLDNIIADKKIELEKQKQLVGLRTLQDRIGSMRKCRNFCRALTKDNPRGINVIAEVKKASPSAGIIRPDFHPVDIALTYQRCGADAISVLTDRKYFGGCLEYLTQVSQAVSIPVLRKDFIIDPYQVYEARAAGADAVLLIAEALKPADILDLMILASQLTMTTLLEVHDADTLLAVRSVIGFPQAHYSLLGINNRNLETMEVDLNTTSRLAGLLDDRKHLVSESGIQTRSDVEKLIALGIGAVLVGQALCRENDIEAAFHTLFDPDCS